VRVAVPVFRDAGGEREVIGAVALTLDLEWLRRLANLQEFSDTSFTIVFSRTGRVILHPRANYAIAETIDTLAEKTSVPELLSIRRNILARRQGVLRYNEPLNARRVHVNYKPVRAAGWGIIVGFDEAEFLKTQRAYRRITFGALAALLILLTGIVVVVTHVALRPLGQLATAADEISRRNLDCEVTVPRRNDEVGGLARSFAAMRDALQAQHLERRWAAQSIEQQLHYQQLIFASMRELVFVLTKTLRISRVNPAVLRVTGHDEASLIQTPLARIVQLADGSGDPSPMLAAALKGEREVDRLSVIVKHREGRELSMLLSVVPIRDGGRVVGAVVTLRDDPAAAATR
jgi:PAS domain S-box-containing protein